MEGAPKFPSQEDKRKTNEKLQKAGRAFVAAVSMGIAAGSPIAKAMDIPEMPLATEKLVVRPEDMNNTALKSDMDAKRETFAGVEKPAENPETIDHVSLKADIEAGRAVFKMNKDGEINRIPSKE